MPKRVLSVGQCGVDHAALARFLADRLDAETVAVDDGEAAVERLDRESFDVVLVNRVLDRDGGDGLEVVRQLVGRGDVPVMLVSNHADWQERAVLAGAVPGFGKAELGSAAATGRLRAVFDLSSAASTDDGRHGSE